MAETTFGKLKIHTRDGDGREWDDRIVDEVFHKDGYFLELLCGAIAAPKNLLDIGGHIGTFALKAASFWPQVRIAAYEPNPESCLVYQRNIGSNGLNAVVHNKAVSYDPSKTCLASCADTGGPVLTRPGELKVGVNDRSRFISHENVRSVTLEQAMQENGMLTVDLLKLDCEGSEMEIFEKMLPETAAKIAFIVGEYHSWEGYPALEKALTARFPDFKVIPLGMPGPTTGNFMAGPAALMRDLTHRYGPETSGQRTQILCTNIKRINLTTGFTPLENNIRLSMFDGPRIDAAGATLADYRVRFTNSATGIVHYESTIQPGMFASCSYRYVLPWHITVEENGSLVFEHRVDFKGQKVFIGINSDGLGDTLAWFPYAEEFRKKHECEIHVSTYWAKLFQSEYPELHFKVPGQNDSTVYYACFVVGSFDNDYYRCKNNWRMIPLQQVASDALGLDYQEVRPRIARSTSPRPLDKPYVAISEFSTFKCKEWLAPGGWKEVIDRLNQSGYEVVSVSKEPSGIDHPRLLKWNGRPIEETINTLQYASAYIGVSSGPAWLAWALGVPVVMISGCTEAWHEMKEGCERIINADVCHGCFNDNSHIYDRGNWLWCPRNKNFECSTKISVDSVWRAVEKHLGKVHAPRFSVLMPTRNRPGLIRRAVDAILNQDFKSFELIIVDDGDSIKDLLPVDERIRYYHRGDNDEGSAGALNHAMSLAQGELFTFQADDDLMLPGALSHVDRTIGEAMWLYGGVLHQNLTWFNPEWNLEHLRARNYIAAPGVFWKREAYKVIGGFDPTLRYANDWDYWIRLGLRWEPTRTEKILVEHTVHANQDSRTHAEEAERNVEKIKARHYEARRILFIAQHLSTGGLPQYLLQRVREVQREGAQVEVIEWTHASPDFTVQRKKLQALCSVHSFYNGNKSEELRKVLARFKPEIVHLQELPELWKMPDDAVGTVYSPHRTWKVVETSHDNTAGPECKKWMPDRFEWASPYHQKIFSALPVPATLHEYQTIEHVRPERTQALLGLGLDPEKFHVLHVGLFCWNKNQGEIFEIARRMPDIDFHFVGNQADNFEAYWKPLMANKPPNCRVWGEREDVDSFYAAMDLFVFPSKRELNPLVLKEALSWQLPIILWDQPIYGSVYRESSLVTIVANSTEAEAVISRSALLLKTEGSCAKSPKKAYDGVRSQEVASAP